MTKGGNPSAQACHPSAYESRHCRIFSRSPSFHCRSFFLTFVRDTARRVSRRRVNWTVSGLLAAACFTPLPCNTYGCTGMWVKASYVPTLLRLLFGMVLQSRCCLALTKATQNANDSKSILKSTSITQCFLLGKHPTWHRSGACPCAKLKPCQVWEPRKSIGHIVSIFVSRREAGGLFSVRAFRPTSCTKSPAPSAPLTGGRCLLIS